MPLIQPKETKNNIRDIQDGISKVAYGMSVVMEATQTPMINELEHKETYYKGLLQEKADKISQIEANLTTVRNAAMAALCDLQAANDTICILLDGE